MRGETFQSTNRRQMLQLHDRNVSEIWATTTRCLVQFYRGNEKAIGSMCSQTKSKQSYVGSEFSCIRLWNDTRRRRNVEIGFRWKDIFFVCKSIFNLNFIHILCVDVPNLVQTVSFYRDVLLNAVETMKQFIKRNNDLRLSIDNVFIRISRPVFRKVDDVFKDGLKTVQWDSKDLATYFAKVDKVTEMKGGYSLQFYFNGNFSSQTLNEVDDFFKNINEIKRRRIEAPFQYISKAKLVVIPDEPVQIDSLYNLNNAYRNKNGNWCTMTAIYQFFFSIFFSDVADKRIEIKSATAELATVEIINTFVQMIDVKTTDDNGQTLLQLPESSQKETNYREELRKPIDKFDWMSFQKISRQVFFHESERFNHRKRVTYFNTENRQMFEFTEYTNATNSSICRHDYNKFYRSNLIECLPLQYSKYQRTQSSCTVCLTCIMTVWMCSVISSQNVWM